jgi:hypothetical protein
MNARLGKALSFSNVIACLALFAALGGTVYAAGKISGKQIKPKSLPGNRIKPRTIAANRIKPRTLTGRQFKQHSLTGRQIKSHSLTGGQIDQATLTGISAAALAGVHYEVTTVPLALNSRDGTTASADCPSGTSAIGGGATVSDDERSFVNDSGPSPQQSGWTATGFIRFGPGATMTITAVCVVLRTPGSSVNSGSGSAPHLYPVYEPF